MRSREWPNLTLFHIYYVDYVLNVFNGHILFWIFHFSMEAGIVFFIYKETHRKVPTKCCSILKKVRWKGSKQKKLEFVYSYHWYSFPLTTFCQASGKTCEFNSVIDRWETHFDIPQSMIYGNDYTRSHQIHLHFKYLHKRCVVSDIIRRGIRPNSSIEVC